jgi:hypothetical protein
MKEMQQAKDSSILNARIFGLAILTSLFLLSGCGSMPVVEPVKPVEVRTIQISRPAPVVPPVDQLQLRDVKWTIVTPDNIDEVFASLSGEPVLFAVTADGYESLALNISDIRAMIQQQQKIIALYQDSYRD